MSACLSVVLHCCLHKSILSLSFPVSNACNQITLTGTPKLYTQLFYRPVNIELHLSQVILAKHIVGYKGEFRQDSKKLAHMLLTIAKHGNNIKVHQQVNG